MSKPITQFDVQVYGELNKFNDVLSKGRVRIFYKYGNRNGTYITDEFAQKLVDSLPYVPLKGIYDGEDFTDHGMDNAEGRIYGIVPENPNFAWEKHLDKDGVEREYACCDVLIFTALYKEAATICGKPQSMELFRNTLKWHDAIIRNQKYIVFDDGCFFGLQALGDGVEPCFEGAAFYSLNDDIQKVIDKINEYTKMEGTDKMEINFRISDNQKFNAIWALLNSNYNEENGWAVDYTISEIYDDYALAYNYAEAAWERIYYAKNDEEDSISISEKKRCYIIDVSEDEMNTLNTLRKLNGGNYDLVNPDLTYALDAYEAIEVADAAEDAFVEEVNANNFKLSGEIENLGAKIVELESLNSTLVMDKEAAEANFALEAQKAKDLSLHCLELERAQKTAVLDEYAEQLPNEILEQYRENIDTYSMMELDKELTYEVKKSNPEVFNKTPHLLPKDADFGGIESILSKYKK